MPLITLTDDEHRRLAELLRDLQGVCEGKNAAEPVNWHALQGRIQSLRLRLFDEE